MEVNLSIKGVPEELAGRLRARAARNHRSLQGELMHIIETAAMREDDAPSSTLTGASGGAPTSTTARRGSKTIEQIAAEHRALYPKPFDRLPRAVDIIRKDRDSR